MGGSDCQSIGQTRRRSKARDARLFPIPTPPLSLSLSFLGQVNGTVVAFWDAGGRHPKEEGGESRATRAPHFQFESRSSRIEKRREANDKKQRRATD